MIVVGQGVESTRRGAEQKKGRRKLIYRTNINLNSPQVYAPQEQ